MNHPFQNPVIKKIFEAYPEEIKNKLLNVREIIFEVANKTPEVERLKETLKWGEPSYLPTNKVGSTIRLGFDKKTNCYAVYFNCKTTLISAFKDLHGNIFKYSGNRAIVFDQKETPPTEIKLCIHMALTYHLQK